MRNHGSCGSFFRWAVIALYSLCVMASPETFAESWGRFRGPNGTGVAENTGSLPVNWSDEKNLVWKTPAARGSSCPILVNDLIVFTGYSGYGEKLDDPGERDSLKLHVIAIARNDGSPKWTLTLDPSPEEQEATPRVADHGYASPTPCTDGEKIYAAFGPSGVVCCSHLMGKRSGERVSARVLPALGQRLHPLSTETWCISTLLLSRNHSLPLINILGKLPGRLKTSTKHGQHPRLSHPKTGPPNWSCTTRNSSEDTTPKLVRSFGHAGAFRTMSCPASLL